MVEIGNHLKTRVWPEEPKEEMIKMDSDGVHFSRLPPACSWWTLHRCSGRTQPARQTRCEREGGKRKSAGKNAGVVGPLQLQESEISGQ